MKDIDKVALTFGQLKKLIKESFKDVAKQKLEYSDQIQFEEWIASYGINAENGAEIYFDSIYAIDATKDNQPIIKGVKANGTMTWGQALKKLQDYFNIRGSDRKELDYDGYVWEINEWVGIDTGRPKRFFVEESDDIFDTPEEAFEDGMEALNACPNKGHFQLVVLLNGAEYIASNFIGKAASKEDGKIEIIKTDNPSADERFIKPKRKW